MKFKKYQVHDVITIARRNSSETIQRALMIWMKMEEYIVNVNADAAFLDTIMHELILQKFE